MGYSLRGRTESDTTEQLNTLLTCKSKLLSTFKAKGTLSGQGWGEVKVGMK